MSEILRLAGPLTMATSAARQEDLVAALAATAAGSVLDVDLSGVGEADSSSVALLLHWLRQARAQGVTLRFVELPAAMTQLVDVYGVRDILSTAP